MCLSPVCHLEFFGFMGKIKYFMKRQVEKKEIQSMKETVQFMFGILAQF